ncbi:hypothetical protein ABPG72_003125 [Tetrahymena utriculariae]
MSFQLMAFIFFQIIFLIKAEQVAQIKTSLRQLQQCNDGQYFDTQQSLCTNCIQNCKTCQDSTSCVTCQSTYFLNQSNNACVDCQQEGFYIEFNEFCKQCDSTCKHCQGPYNTQCTDCYDGFYLDKNGSCVNCKQQGFYVALDKTCQECNYSCKSCSGKDQCTECQDGFYLQINQTDNTKSCQQCYSSCLTCNGPNFNQCLTCSSTLFKLFYYNQFQNQYSDCIGNQVFVSNGVCKQCDYSCLTCQNDSQVCNGCKYGYYQNNQGESCNACEQTCGSCNGPLNTNCKLCNIERYLETDNTCQLCDPSCLRCNRPANTDCIDCKIGYSFQGKICIKCDQSCARCTGIGPSECKECYTNNYLTLDNKCKICQEDGWYISGKNCLQCQSPCSTCQGQANLCLTCEAGLYLFPDNTCATCPTDKSYFTQNNSCLQCSQNCLTCSLNEKNCLTCQSGQYLTKDNKCVDCQQNGFFISDKTCQACDSSCLNCNGTEKNNCTQCQPGFFQTKNNECVACDQIGQFKEGSKCIQCDISCATCDEIQNNKCLSCKSGQYLTLKNQCTSCLDNGYFLSQNQCLLCDPTCLKCNGTTNKDCLSCAVGNYLNENNQCISCDPNRFFISGDNCFQCDSSCATCNGKTSTDCLSCSKGQYLLVSNNTCISNCNTKNGYFISGSKCIECDKSCKTCSGELETNCLTCVFGLIFQPSLNKCDRCEEEQFLNKSTDECEYCDQTCVTCTGKNKNECKLCANGLVLSKVTNTCENSTTIKNQQGELDQIQKIGCLNQQSKSDSDCMSRIETSESQTLILNVLSISSIVLTILSSTITYFGASIGQIFIQNYQSIGNYIFASKLNSLQMNQFELKTYYSYHIFTIIPNIFKQPNGRTLYSFKLFNTLIPINDFSDSFFNNCCLSVLTLAVIIIFTVVILSTSTCKNNQMNSKNSKLFRIFSYVKWNLFINFFRLASSFLILNTVYLLQYQSHLEKLDLIFMAISMPLYLILELYWSIKIGPQYYSISSNDLASIDSLTQKIEISDQLSRIFWLVFECKKVIITIIQSIFIFTTDKQHLSCWIHSALNILFIVYISIKKPFIEKKINYFVILLEILNTGLIILIGIILAQDNGQNLYNAPSLSLNMQQIFRYLSFGILGGIMLFQLFMIFQRLINYTQQFQYQRKIRVTNNTTTQQIEQLNETNINQIFEMLDQKKNNINWKKF